MSNTFQPNVVVSGAEFCDSGAAHALGKHGGARRCWTKAASERMDLRLNITVYVLLFLGGGQLVLLGVLSEYVGRI